MSIFHDIHDEKEQIKATSLEDKFEDQQVETWPLVVEKEKHGEPLRTSEERQVMSIGISYVLQDTFAAYVQAKGGPKLTDLFEFEWVSLVPF